MFGALRSSAMMASISAMPSVSGTEEKPASIPVNDHAVMAILDEVQHLTQVLAEGNCAGFDNHGRLRLNGACGGLVQGYRSQQLGHSRTV